MKKGFLAVILLIGFGPRLFAQTSAEQPVEISAKQSLQKVINTYLSIKDALATDDSDKAKTAAIALCDAIEKVPANKLSSQQKKSWTKISDNLVKDAQKVKNSTTIDGERMYFMPLSETMHKLLGAIKINTVTLYYQYCETAKAYWISKDATIHNPYFGKKMPDCGYTKEMLRGKKK